MLCIHSTTWKIGVAHSKQSADVCEWIPKRTHVWWHCDIHVEVHQYRNRNWITNVMKLVSLKNPGVLHPLRSWFVSDNQTTTLMDTIYLGTGVHIILRFWHENASVAMLQKAVKAAFYVSRGYENERRLTSLSRACHRVILCVRDDTWPPNWFDADLWPVSHRRRCAECLSVVLDHKHCWH